VGFEPTISAGEMPQTYALDSENQYKFDEIYQCRMYSGKLLMMGRGTARNM
jgi:hypothetical protein